MAKLIDDVLRRKASEELGLNENEIMPDASLELDLGMDSLDLAELVMVAEEEFGVEIDDEIADGLETFGDLVAVVERLVARKKGSAA